ncbi:hypothetical protein K503DRAFT_721947 [Rhizopogon vinicolor AM-OR11-026]|uniref:Queuosine 5'-phosphate N-glycosylase/hydrolase n=1 Tax=Rhizopogon vinicolor AM-OR11-026 TaxID=1314800 RepID=A0A1B7MTZ8_9AGAM|nr:hypothetical protein K503DRAFT_721947 [Rhizopogon vinicolor AM-OR11-026]
MHTLGPDLPSPGTFVTAVKESCRAATVAANIKVEDAAIRRLLESPSFQSSFQRVSRSHGVAFPLKFSSILSELNFLSVLCLLNFASGYRVPLHEQTGRGAWDNIRAFTFSLYLSSATGQGDLLSAKGMKTMSEQQVAQHMGVTIHVERPHESIPGLTVGELGGPIYDVVKLISSTLTETGQILDNSGYSELGSLVLESLKEGGKADPDASLGVVLERLVRAIPAFRDMTIVDGQAVYCFKKALFLIHAVKIRFGSVPSPPFPIPNTDRAPAFSDNVLPSILVHLGVLDLSGATSHGLHKLFPDATSEDKINTLLDLPPEASQAVAQDTKKMPPKEGPVLTKEQAYILRAAAVYACEKIVEYVRGDGQLSEEQTWMKDITSPALDTWLWAIAKDRPDYRKLERFVLRDTVFF